MTETNEFRFTSLATSPRRLRFHDFPVPCLSNAARPAIIRQAGHIIGMEFERLLQIVDRGPLGAGLAVEDMRVRILRSRRQAFIADKGHAEPTMRDAIIL